MEISVRSIFQRLLGIFEKLPYESYDKKRPKNRPTVSYFYPARQLEKCMIISDALKPHVYPVKTDMNNTKQILTSHICSTDER